MLEGARADGDSISENSRALFVFFYPVSPTAGAHFSRRRPSGSEAGKDGVIEGIFAIPLLVLRPRYRTSAHL
jgi:hypothetical protein